MKKFYLSDQNIRDLVGSPKEIVGKEPIDGFLDRDRNWRCDLELHSNMEGDAFSAFARQNKKYPENFSVGLYYKTKEKKLGSVVLVRYNGRHGEPYKNSDGHYGRSHIHHMTSKKIMSGSIKPQPDLREITDRYKTFDDALQIFFKDVGIIDYLEFFPDLRSRLL